MESEFPGKCTSTLRVLNIDKVAAWGIIIPLINSAMKQDIYVHDDVFSPLLFNIHVYTGTCINFSIYQQKLSTKNISLS